MKISLFTLLAMSSLSANPQAMNAVDVFSIPLTRNASLAPDGRALIFEKSEVNWARNQWVSQLWSQSLMTDELRQLTFNPNGSWDPHWSPDGQHLLFLSEREGDENPQLYVMPTDGGEARRLGKLDQSPSNLQWSPDGSWIYFLSESNPPNEDKELIKSHKIIPQFENPDRINSLRRLKLSDGTLETISMAGQSVFDYHLAQDGQQCIILQGEGSLLDDIHQADLWLSQADGSQSKRLTDNAIAEFPVSLSPDNSHFAYTASVNEMDEGYYESKLFVVQIATGERTLLSKAFQGEVLDFSWDQDGTGIYFLGNIGVSSHLFHLELSTGELAQLTSGPWTINGWSYHRESNSHLFNRTNGGFEGDYWMLTKQEAPEQVTRIFDETAEKFRMPREELVTWKGSDGVTIEGLLTYPLDYQEGTPFPLIVDTHGGPQKSDQYGMGGMVRYLPVLSAYGYGTLRCNHRGSTGYGDGFMRDMVGNYFRNSHLDVLAGIDHLIAEGLADPDRLIKKGWSAGGHMTNKLITSTDRFRVASSGAGVVDWASQFGETDTSYRRAWWFGGKPWQEDAPSQNYLETSVMKDLWKVKTPTLIFVGEKDVRVPASQSKMLFRALRDQGVETELYIAPGEPHGFRKPSHRLFRINKELEWFERHVHGKDYLYSLPPEEEE